MTDASKKDVLKEIVEKQEGPQQIIMPTPTGPELQDTAALPAKPVTILGKYIATTGKADPTTIAEARSEVSRAFNGQRTAAVIGWARYLDPQMIENPVNYFVGPDFPYAFAWIAIASDPQQSAAAKGYRPVRLSDPKFLDALVIGEDALSLAIDRSPRMMASYSARKVTPPAPLRDHLKDKFGTFMPPVTDERGFVMVGNRQLWYTEKELVQQRRASMKPDDRSVVVTSANFLADEVGGQVERTEYDVDSAPPNVIV